MFYHEFAFFHKRTKEIEINMCGGSSGSISSVLISWFPLWNSVPTFPADSSDFAFDKLIFYVSFQL